MKKELNPTTLVSEEDNDEIVLTGKEFWKIMTYSKNKFLICITYFFCLLCGTMPLVINVVFSKLIDVFNTDNFSKDEFNKFFKLNLILTIINVSNYITIFALKSCSNPSFMHDLREALYRQLMRQDIKFFDKTSTGILVGHLSQDVAILYQVYIERAMQTVQDVTQAFGGLILSYITIWQVALPVTGIIIICSIIYYFGDKQVHKYSAELNANGCKSASKAEEAITSFRTIKSFDNEMYEANLYEKSLVEVDSIVKKTSMAQGIKDSTIWGIAAITTVGFVYLSAYFIVKKPSFGYVSGDLLILIFCLVFSVQSISSMLSLSDDFSKARLSAAKVLKILEKEPEVDQEEQGQKNVFKLQKQKNQDFDDSINNYFKGRIEFQNVGFRYQTMKKNNKEWAVRNLSFVVEPGQTVALVGESGCGKSTTLQLIQRFYEIEEGKILVDGVDIGTINPQYLRTLISVVPQGPVLFSMSIKDNIRYSREYKNENIKNNHNNNENNNNDLDDNDEVISAARIGNAHEFIIEMPDKYESKVQQTSLSGGQKQRICISRAILANTPILLMDEATASLDTESERLVQDSLERFRKGVTAIVVAHRLATVMNADKIVVIKEGHVEEEGTHHELLEKNGLYANLVKFQLQ